MIVRPSPNDGVELFYQFLLRHAGGALDNCSDLALGHIEKALDVPDGSIARACRLAGTLGFAIDAGLVPLLPELPATEVDG